MNTREFNTGGGSRCPSCKRVMDRSVQPTSASADTSGQSGQSPSHLLDSRSGEGEKYPHNRPPSWRAQRAAVAQMLQQSIVGVDHLILFRLLPGDLLGGTQEAIRAIDGALRRLYLHRLNAPSGWRAATERQDPHVVARAALASALQALDSEVSGDCHEECPSPNSTTEGR